MKNLLSYSTKYIDNEIKRSRESTKHGIDTATDFKEMLYQRLDRRIAEQAYDWIINSLRDLFLWYAGDGDIRMQLDDDYKAAKENYFQKHGTTRYSYDNMLHTFYVFATCYC